MQGHFLCSLIKEAKQILVYKNILDFYGPNLISCMFYHEK